MSANFGVKHVSPRHLSYAHLNLRRNPFGELSQDERASLAVVDVESVVANLASNNYAVQFVGEKGYGKTTHLLAIRGRFAQAGYVHIPEGERAIIPSGNPILIDEAQRLTLWQRLRLFRSEVPLVLGTHRDFSRELRCAGRILQTIDVQCGTSAQRLHQLLNARVAHVQRAMGPVPVVSQTTVNQLRDDYGSDIRAMLHRMYVTFQNLSGVCDV